MLLVLFLFFYFFYFRKGRNFRCLRRNKTSSFSFYEQNPSTFRFCSDSFDNNTFLDLASTVTKQNSLIGCEIIPSTEENNYYSAKRYGVYSCLLSEEFVVPCVDNVECPYSYCNRSVGICSPKFYPQISTQDVITIFFFFHTLFILHYFQKCIIGSSKTSVVDNYWRDRLDRRNNTNSELFGDLIRNSSNYICTPKLQNCRVEGSNCSSSIENLNQTQCMSYGYCVPLGKYGMSQQSCVNQTGNFSGQCQACLKESQCYPIKEKKFFCQVLFPKELCNNIVFPTTKYPALLWDEELKVCKIDDRVIPVNEFICQFLSANSSDKRGSCQFSLDLSLIGAQTDNFCGGNYINSSYLTPFRTATKFCQEAISTTMIAEEDNYLTYPVSSDQCRLKHFTSPFSCAELPSYPQNSFPAATLEFLYNLVRYTNFQVNFRYNLPTNWTSTKQQFASEPTQSQCTNELKVCTKEGEILSGDACNEIECVGKRCSSCQNAGEYVYEEYCFSTNLTLCTCRLIGGVWASYQPKSIDSNYFTGNTFASAGLCKFPSLNSSECLSKGYKYASCEGLSSVECNRCSQNNFDSSCYFPDRVNLRCSWKETSCPASECTPHCSGMEEFPACLSSIDALVNTMGCYECPGGLTPSFLGCLNVTRGINVLEAQKYCNVTGGVWIEKADTEAKCNSFLGCKTSSSDVCNKYFPNNIGNGLLKSGESCLAPLGSVRNVFRWVKPSMQPLQRVNATWFSQAWVAENEWTGILNYSSINTKFEEALSLSVARSYQSYGVCRYVTFENYFSDVLESCLEPIVLNIFPNTTKTKTVKESKKDIEDPYPNLIFARRAPLTSSFLGVFNLFPKQETIFSVGSAKVQSFENSLPSQTSYTLLMTHYPISQFMVNLTTLSDDKSFQTLPVKNNSYAVVSNKNGFKVGQFIGDGARITISRSIIGVPFYPDDRIDYGTSKINETTLFNSTRPTLLFCAEIRRDIKLDPNFVVYAWATTNNFEDFVVVANSQVSIIENFMCSNVSFSSILFPVAVIENWESAIFIAPILTDKQTAYYSVLAGLFWIVGIAGTVTIVLLFVASSMLMQILIIIFLSIHALSRAIFFTLVASERIILDQVDTKGEQAGILFLTFLHLALFYTCYSLLSFWWTWFTQRTKDNRSLATRSLIILIIKNLCIYLFFFAVVVLFGSLKNQNNAQKSLRGYTITIAILSVIDLIFIIYLSVAVFLGSSNLHLLFYYFFIFILIYSFFIFIFLFFIFFIYLIFIFIKTKITRRSQRNSPNCQ